MPSSIFLGAYALQPEVAPSVWEMGDWFDPQTDGGFGELGDTSISMSESGFIQCPDGSYGSGVDACPPTSATGSPTQCSANEVLVSSSDWAAPVCMNAQMAMAYGAGLQQQKGSSGASASSLLSGITGTTAEWLALGVMGILLISSLGGRRR